jgi:hypothetical protein
MARFLDANGLAWGPPDVGVDATVVERMAAGEAGHDEVVTWSATAPAKRGRTARRPLKRAQKFANCALPHGEQELHNPRDSQRFLHLTPLGTAA